MYGRPTPGSAGCTPSHIGGFGGLAVLYYLQTTVWDHPGAWIAIKQPIAQRRAHAAAHGA